MFHIGDSFSRLQNMAIHLKPGEHKYLFKWSSPSRAGKLYWFITARSGSEFVPCFSFLRLYILWGSGSTTCLSLPVRMWSRTRFTSSAFVFNPFATSPRHLSQNLSSEVFNSSGFLPRREAPGISFSVRNVGFETVAIANEERRDAMSWPFWPRFHATRSRTFVLSAIMKVVYSTSFCSLFDLVNNFKVTLDGSSRALKCNSIYLIKGPLISFW